MTSDDLAGLTDEERSSITGPGGTNDWIAALAAVEAILTARLAETTAQLAAARLALAACREVREAREA